MPPKRRQNIGRKTVKARARVISRASESPQTTQERLSENKFRSAASRASETPEVTQERLNDKRLRSAASRASETPEATQERLSYKRLRLAASRAAPFARLDWERAVFNYSPNTPYQSHSVMQIGNMEF